MKKKILPYLVTLAAAGTIVAVIIYNGSQMAQAKGPMPPPKPNMPAKNLVENKAMLKPQEVAISSVRANAYQAQVVGYGEIKSHYELNFASDLSGRVKSLGKSFAIGMVIKKGDVIATLDNTAYKQAVSQATSEVTAAKLALLEEQRQGKQAKSEWERSGLRGKPSSSLVLREPQLANAKAKLAHAEQMLVKAKADLANTIVRAPFNALVVSRDIQLGSYLNVGSSIGKLYSIDHVEVEIPLSDQQWDKLSSDAKSLSITLFDSTGQKQWKAKVDRTFQHVNNQTRQRALIAVVDKPLEQSTPLYPGTFVKASLQGAKIDNLWELPASALSQQGEIWLIDEKGMLAKHSTSPEFEYQDKIYVSPVSGQSEAKVIMRPLSNFKVGMKVSPVEAG